MVKYFYLLMLTLLSFAGRAQVQKGDVLLGGTLQFNNNNYSFSTVNSEKKTVTVVGPSFGVAVKRNLELGARFLYQYSKDDQSVTYQNPTYTYQTYNRTTGYGLAVYLRKYKELSQRFSIYVEGDLTGNTVRAKQDYNGTKDYVDRKSWSVTASGTAGVVYRMGSRWMLETGFTSLVSVGIGHMKDDGVQVAQNGLVDKTSYVSVGTNLSQMLTSFSFGCRYILN